jgi:hypothetical protein
MSQDVHTARTARRSLLAARAYAAQNAARTSCAILALRPPRHPAGDVPPAPSDPCGPAVVPS